MLCECFCEQLVVYQTEGRGKKGCFPRRHSLDVFHQQLRILLGGVVVKLYLHVHDFFVTERDASVKNKRTDGMVKRWVLNTHFAAKDVKSSCMMFEVERLDRMFFSAPSLMSLIPSFSMRQHQERLRIGDTHCRGQRIHRTRRTRLLLLRTFHRIALVLRRLEGREGDLVRVGVGKERQPPAESISYLSYGRSEMTYVFHAPDITITTSRFSVEVASVWYLLHNT